MQRQKDEGAAVLVEDGHLLGRDGIDVDQQVVEGEHNTLGETCSAGGVENHTDVAVLKTDASFLCLGMGRERGMVVHAQDGGLNTGLLYSLASHLLCLLAHPDGLGLGIVHDICHIVDRAVCIHGDGNATVLPHGEETVYPLYRVLGKDDGLGLLLLGGVLGKTADFGKHFGIGNLLGGSHYGHTVNDFDLVFVKHVCSGVCYV